MKDMTPVIDAMNALIKWEELETFCQARTYCDGCPYHKTKPCDKTSTENVLRMTAIVFREFLQEREE